MVTEKEKLVVINKQLRLGDFLDSVPYNFFKHVVYRVMEKALDLGLGEVGSSPYYAVGCVTRGKTLMGLPHFKVVRETMGLPVHTPIYHRGTPIEHP